MALEKRPRSHLRALPCADHLSSARITTVTIGSSNSPPSTVSDQSQVVDNPGPCSSARSVSGRVGAAWEWVAMISPPSSPRSAVGHAGNRQFDHEEVGPSGRWTRSPLAVKPAPWSWPPPSGPSPTGPGRRRGSRVRQHPPRRQNAGDLGDGPVKFEAGWSRLPTRSRRSTEPSGGGICLDGTAGRPELRPSGDGVRRAWPRPGCHRHDVGDVPRAAPGQLATPLRDRGRARRRSARRRRLPRGTRTLGWCAASAYPPASAPKDEALDAQTWGQCTRRR